MWQNVTESRLSLFCFSLLCFLHTVLKCNFLSHLFKDFLHFVTVLFLKRFKKWLKIDKKLDQKYVKQTTVLAFFAYCCCISDSRDKNWPRSSFVILCFCTKNMLFFQEWQQSTQFWKLYKQEIMWWLPIRCHSYFQSVSQLLLLLLEGFIGGFEVCLMLKDCPRKPLR